jgi:hypothetical protein
MKSFSQNVVVMAGLDPAIHVFPAATEQDVDARDKRGHDGEILGAHC